MFGGNAAAMTGSWHVNYVRRTELRSPYWEGDNTFRHEFVHNKQYQRSFLFEKTGEPGSKEFNYADANEYLNW